MKILFISSSTASLKKHRSLIQSLRDYGYNYQSDLFFPEVKEEELKEIEKEYRLVFTDCELIGFSKNPKFMITKGLNTEDIISDINNIMVSS